MHILIAKDCIQFSRHLLTASYVDEHIKALENEIRNKDLLFLCEMGLDPGIDHMSAVQLIQSIKNQGGEITSFKSHCGGLVAPESDDNPWHYKISWNSRNVVMAGKAGALYKENSAFITKNYKEIFTQNNQVDIPALGKYSYYPNRDSVAYAKLYGLEAAHTFIRTTLRHPDFCVGWKAVIDLQLTNETSFYDTNGLSLSLFFKDQIAKSGFKIDNELILKQLQYLGLEDDTMIDKETCSSADILQFILEKKLPLHPHDKDMIVMLHEMEYKIHNKAFKRSSCLIVKGENNTQTAMAKTVGLPLGIAAKLLLENKLTERGLHIPVSVSIYEPVLAELAQNGIVFSEF